MADQLRRINTAPFKGMNKYCFFFYNNILIQGVASEGKIYHCFEFQVDDYSLFLGQTSHLLIKAFNMNLVNDDGNFVLESIP